MASRSNNPTSVSTHLAPSERIPTSTLFGGKSPNPLPSSSASSSSSSSPIPIGRPSAGPGIGPAGRVGSTGPVAGRGAGAGASGLGKRRGPGAGLSLAGMGASIAPPSSSSSPPGLNGQTNGKGPPIAPPNSNNNNQTQQGGTPFSNFSKIVDPSGSLNFQNKAVLHAKGVDFSNGSSFNINMGELELQDELGSGNYGTVQKVYHKVTKVTMAMKVGWAWTEHKTRPSPLRGQADHASFDRRRRSASSSTTRNSRLSSPSSISSIGRRHRRS